MRKVRKEMMSFLSGKFNLLKSVSCWVMELAGLFHEPEGGLNNRHD